MYWDDMHREMTNPWEQTSMSAATTQTFLAHQPVEPPPYMESCNFGDETFGDDTTPGIHSCPTQIAGSTFDRFKTHPIYPYVSSTTYLEWHYATDTMEI